MKIEDLKVGRVYRAKRPRGVHRLDGTRRGWRIISIVKGNGDFWATLELETEKNND